MLCAISTYSVIPVPQVEWEDRAGEYALAFFPAVGLFCAAAEWGWYTLSRARGWDSILSAAVSVCIPLAVTGGIHMDGYMDTVDAVASHRERARKLEILKDPHCGAFAPLWCGMYLLMSFGLTHALFAAGTFPAVLPGYVLSRALSALCAQALPNARGGGMLYTYTGGRGRRAVLLASVATAVLSGVSMLCLSPRVGLAALTAALLTAAGYRAMALKLFGGVTGDTAGFFLTVCELAVLAGAWIGS